MNGACYGSVSFYTFSCCYDYNFFPVVYVFIFREYKIMLFVNRIGDKGRCCGYARYSLKKKRRISSLY